MTKFVTNYFGYSVYLLVLTALLLLISKNVFSSDSCFITDLPESVRQFISDEQSFESLSVSAIQNLPKWDSPYTPSKKPTFSIKGCWLSQNQFAVMGGKVLKDENSSVVKQFFRSTAQGEEILFFVHPDPGSIEEYKKIGFDIASPDYNCVNFCATPTSSNRSLVVWAEESNSAFKPVIVKTSLNAFLGNYIKTVSEGEAVKSFTINKLLSQQQVGDQEFGQRFRFFREPLAFSLVSPKSLGTNFAPGAGMVVRKIPEELMNGQLRVVSAFALYGDPVSNSDIPYLLKAFKGKSRSLLDEVITEKIIKPFVADWLKAIIDWGLVTESHGQNLLVELDQGGLPNGRFWYRDIDGFDLEFSSRKLRGLGIDNAIKSASTEDMDRSIRKIFNMFIYQLQQAIDSWEKNGLILKSDVHIPYETVLRIELISQLEKFASLKYRLVLKENLAEKLEAVDKVVWYKYLINAVLQLQRMTALDSAAERGESTDIIEEQLGAEKSGISHLENFGFRFSKAIEFFQNLEKGNEAQERIRALRIEEMKSQEKNPGGFDI